MEFHVGLGEHDGVATKDCFDRDSNQDACWYTEITLDNTPSETGAIQLDTNSYDLIIEAYDFNTVGEYQVTINAIFQDGFTKLSSATFTLVIEAMQMPSVTIDTFGTTVESG